MKKILCIIVLTGIVAGFLQSETIIFTKTIGGDNNDYARCIQETRDSGYIITGYTKLSGADNYDVYLIKTDARGNVVWSKTFGGEKNDYGYFVTQTSDGGYIITGSTQSIIPEGLTPGPAYAYLIKTDEKGNETWSRSYGQGTTDIGECVLQKPDGGYIVIGGTGSYSTSVNMMILETDTKGNIMEKKSKKHETVSIYSPGRDGFDVGHSAVNTHDNNYVFAGETEQSGIGNIDVYLVNMNIDFQNNDSKIVWEKTFGGKDIDNARSIQKTSDGGYIIAGNTGKEVDGSDLFDMCLIKTDSKGNETWSKTFGGKKNDTAYDVQQTVGGGYIIAGTTYSSGSGKSDVCIIKTDEKGNEIWSRTFGGKGYDGAYSIRLTSDGGFIIAGYSTSGTGGDADIYIIKTDSLGNIKAEKRKYSYQDFIDAAKTRHISRLLEYIDEPVTFILIFRGEASEPGSINKEEIKKLLFELLDEDPAFWKYSERDDEKYITYVIDYWIIYTFYFEQKGDKLLMKKIVKNVTGL